MTFFSKKLHQKWGWDWDLNKSLGLTLIQYKKLLNVKNKSDINNIAPALFLLTLNIILLPLLLTLNISTYTLGYNYLDSVQIKCISIWKTCGLSKYKLAMLQNIFNFYFSLGIKLPLF